MSLAEGTKLGNFEITGPLGKGGMGEVYRARDTKLGREVAIKVLLESLASDPERLARFEREAQTIAALNHANIAIVHGFEHDEQLDLHFLIMEFIDGNTLGNRLASTPMSSEDAIPIFIDIARGLDAAHDQGIVHRDLKPDNIKLNDSGVVKILDFGLAKFTPQSKNLGPNEPTTPMSPVGLTVEGTLMGTPMYMSPEQARGKNIDQRTDVWAFGCCLFEALTGDIPFKGDTVVDTLGAILEREPDWSELPASLPPHIDSLVRGCLVKDQSKRIPNMHAIIEILEGSPGATVLSQNLSAPMRATPRKSFGIAQIITVSIIALLIAYIVFIRTGSEVPISSEVQTETAPEPKQVKRYLLGLDVANMPKNGSNFGRVTISPDGGLLAYITTDKDDERLIAVRRIDELEGRILSGTNGAWTPFFSPDGQSIGYISPTDKKMKSIPVEGGSPRVICDLRGGFNASWGDDGYIVFADDDHRELQRVIESGGTPEPVTSLELTPGSIRHANPCVLPDGAGILFASFKSYSDPEDRSLNVLTRDGEVLPLVGKATVSHYSSTGHVLYFVKDQGVFARRFDLNTYAIGDDDYRITESRFGTAASRLFDISRTGTLVYAADISTQDDTPLVPDRDLVWVGLDGAESLPLPIRAKPYADARISPDGTKVALASEGDIFIYDITRTTISPVAFSAELEFAPVWSPDSLVIAYSSSMNGTNTFYKRNADGTGIPISILQHPGILVPESWSPDGNTLTYVQLNPGTNIDIGITSLNADANATPELKISSIAIEGATTISPDGNWIAYASVDSGQSEVYVTSFPEFEGKWIISVGGGEKISWAPNGDALYYRGGNKLMKVPVETKPTFKPGKPELLWEREYYSSNRGNRTYDIHPDGGRFIMIKKADQLRIADSSDDIIVIENWFEELKRLAPVSETK